MTPRAARCQPRGPAMPIPTRIRTKVQPGGKAVIAVVEETK